MKHWWQNEEKTILILDTEGDWTWQDARLIVKRQYQEIAAVDHPVQTICLVNGKLVNGRTSALLELKSLMEIVHPNEDMVIFVGNHYLLRTLINMVDRLYRMNSLTSKFRYVNSLNDALTVLVEHETAKDSAQA